MKSNDNNIAQFVVFVRTKQFMQHRFKDRDPISHVYISMNDVRRFLNFPQIEIQSLIDVEAIGVIKKNTNQGHVASYYKVLVSGEIDIALLKQIEIRYNELEQYMIKSLQLVSLDNIASIGILITPYFDCFLKNKDKFINHFFTVDSFSGRVHTPITNFKAEYRSNILLDGEKTTSLDVVTMQPLLLGRILQEHIGDNQFSKWISSGEDIYQIIELKLKLSSRDRAKEYFFKILFSKPSERLSNVFGNSLWIQWVNSYKRQVVDGNPYSKFKPHSNLAWLLQTTEVQVMRKVWQEFKVHNILFLTIHDEVVVKKSDCDFAFQLMNDVLIAEFNFFRITKK